MIDNNKHIYKFRAKHLPMLFDLRWGSGEEMIKFLDDNPFQDNIKQYIKTRDKDKLKTFLTFYKLESLWESIEKQPPRSVKNAPITKRIKLHYKSKYDKVIDLELYALLCLFIIMLYLLLC